MQYFPQKLFFLKKFDTNRARNLKTLKVKHIVESMLDKNENLRITMPEVRDHPWLNDYDRIKQIDRLRG